MSDVNNTSRTTISGLPQAMLFLLRLQTTAGLDPVLRRPQRRDLLQALLRQELRAQGVRLRRLGFDARSRGR